MSTGTGQEHGHAHKRTHTHTPQTQTMTQKQQKQISGRFETGMGTDIGIHRNTYRQRHEQRTGRHANTQNQSSLFYTGKKQTTAIVPNQTYTCTEIHRQRHKQAATPTDTNRHNQSSQLHNTHTYKGSCIYI